MKEPVYISKHFDSIKKKLIIEENKHSIWSYLVDSENDNEIIMDRLVCSTGTNVKKTSEVKDYIDKGFASPVSEEYVNRFTIQKDLIELDFKIEIFDNKVTVLIKNDRFVVLDIVNLIHI